MKTIDAVCQVLVCDEDFDLVCDIGWFINENGYARGYDPASGDLVYMHRLIMGLSSRDTRIVDHVNRRTWDNRRDNLRIVSRSENALNSPANRKKRIAPPADRIKSAFKGVHWRHENAKWGAAFRGKYLGIFDHELDAARAYNDAAIASGIESVWLNPLPETESAPSRYGGNSRYRGVQWNKQQGKWHAQYLAGGERFHAGYYVSERTAALVRDAVVRAIGGDVPLNFPNESTALPEKITRSLRRKGLI